MATDHADPDAFVWGRRAHPAARRPATPPSRRPPPGVVTARPAGGPALDTPALASHRDRAGTPRLVAIRIVQLGALALLAACRGNEAQETLVSAALVGTWAQVAGDQRPSGRDLITRHADGRLELQRTLRARTHPPCEGRWKVTEGGNAYVLRLLTTGCVAADEAGSLPVGEVRYRLVSVVEREAVFAEPEATDRRRVERRIDP